MANAMAHAVVVVIRVSFMQVSIAYRAEKNANEEGAIEIEKQQGCLSRLDEISKQRWWSSEEDDPLFPPIKSSIGETCVSMSMTCDELNHWADFRKVAKGYGTEFLVVSQKTTKAKTQTFCTHTVLGEPCIFPFIDNKGIRRTECWQEEDESQDSCATTNKDLSGGYYYDFCKCQKGRYGIHYTDIGQGKLANCYVLAAMASLAKASPDFINSCFHNMDADQTHWVTKWYVAGKRVNVFTDDMIPANPDRPFQPIFLHLGGTGEFWPIILEKAWAKLYGSYEATDRGTWAEAGFALTGAPHTYYKLGERGVGLERLKQILLDATADGFPMGAGTYDKETREIKRIGVATSHGYSVFHFKDNIVTVSNPWGTNGYKGDLAKPGSKPLSGKFQMTINEFFAAFKDLSVLNFHANYQPNHFPAKVGKAEAISLTMTLAKPFYIMLVWPSKRLLKSSCNKGNLDIVTTLGAMKENCIGCPVQVAKEICKMSGITWVRLQGPGKFNVFWNLGLVKETAGLFTEAAVLVYADKGEKLENVKNWTQPGIIASEIFLPTGTDGKCSLYWVDGIGMFELQMDKTVNGVPRLFNQRVGFFYYDTEDHEWKLTTEDKWSAVSEQGVFWAWDKRTKDHFKCSTGAEILKQVAPVDKLTGHQCKKIFFPKAGVLVLHTDVVGYVPVYRNNNVFVYYDAKESVWMAAPNAKWGDVSKGKRPAFAKYNKNDFGCGDEIHAFQMFGLVNCATIFLSKYGLFTLMQEKVVNDMPTYWRNDGFMYFSFRHEKWIVAPKDEYNMAKANGESDEYWTEHDKSELTCKTGGEALAELLEPVCRGRAIKALMFENASFFENPQRPLNGMSTYESPEKNIAYFSEGTSWQLTGPEYWHQVLGGAAFGSKTVETPNIVCGCHNTDTSSIHGFGTATCKDVKVGEEKYSFLKCNGAKNADKVKTYCPETCNICKK